MNAEHVAFQSHIKGLKTILMSAFMLFAPIYVSASPLKSEVIERIQTIPLKDRERIEKLFRDHLFFYEFAYTLFGDKPVSSGCFDRKHEETPELFCIQPDGYLAWEKYAHLFPSKNYLFLFFEDMEADCYELTLINKQAFRRIVDKHREKFADVFGPDIHPEKLLNLLVQKRSLWNTPMRGRPDLIGILLGYGKTNAELFQKRSEILMSNPGIKKRRTQPSQSFDSIDEELNFLNASLKSFSNEGKVSLYFMHLPGFVACHQHEETVQLKQKYIQQRKYITQHYARRKVLETTLEQLMTENSSSMD